MTETAATVTPAPPAEKARTMADRARKVAGLVQTELVGRGGRAELRRMRSDPERVPPAIFWALLERAGVPPAESREDAVFRALVPLMTDVPYAARPLGRALRDAGVSDHRLQAFLRKPGDAAQQQLSRLLRPVEGGLEWGEVAELMMWWDQEHAGTRRRKVARDFFIGRDTPVAAADTNNETEIEDDE